MSTPDATPRASMSLPLQGVRGEAGRDDGIARREPGPGEQEDPAEEEGDADLGYADRRTGAVVHRWNDLEVPLQPDAGETHEREPQHGRRILLRLHAQEADEGNDEDQEEHRHSDRPPRPVQPVE